MHDLITIDPAYRTNFTIEIKHMETLKFKTNIKCGGCIAAVKPNLDKVAGAENWFVDTAVPEKLLTITADQTVTAASIMEAVQQAGYTAVKLN